MKFISLVLFLISSFSLSACVTTRAQLHQERAAQQGEEELNNDPAHEPTVESKPSKNQNSSQSSAQNSGGYSVEELKSMVASLTGKVEELEQNISKSGDQHGEELKKLYSRIDELEKKANAAPEVVKHSDKDEFEVGKEAYRAGKYDEAIDAFEEYLKNPQAGTHEEAIMLKGEAHFKQKNFKKAIVEFSKISEKFPKSKENPKALMRIAESFDGLGMKEDAKAFYTDLIDKFPKSPEAKAAKKRISKKK